MTYKIKRTNGNEYIYYNVVKLFTRNDSLYLIFADGSKVKFDEKDWYSYREL